MEKGKNTKWFPHDSDALGDPKIMMLITQLGFEAYGLYWMLIERLCVQPGYSLPLNLIDAISRREGISREKLETIISKFGLFEITDDAFFSPSLIRRMEPFENRMITNSLNAKKGWEKRKINAIAMRSHSDGNEDNITEHNITEHNITEEKKKEILYSESENDSELSSFFKDILKLYDWSTKGTIKETNEKVFPDRFIPKTEKQKRDWIKCLQDLVKIDGYSLQEINRAIIFARSDPFWKDNFLSLLKLRLKDKQGVKYIDKFLLGYEKANANKPKPGEDYIDMKIREVREARKVRLDREAREKTEETETE